VKTKQKTKYALYALVPFLIVLNVSYVNIYGLSCTNVDAETSTYKKILLNNHINKIILNACVQTSIRKDFCTDL